MDRALAASGLLVVAIDMTLAPEAPYPACVQDANYAVRWLKANAAAWNGDTSKLGVYGTSSGGHVAELLAMRPRDPRYNAIPLARRRTSTPPSPGSRRARRSATPSRATRTRSGGRTRQHDQEQQDVLRPVGNDPRKQPAGNPRARREGHAGAAARHAGCARRQRAAGSAGKIRQDLQGRRRQCASTTCSRTAVHEWVADPGPRPTRRATRSRPSSRASCRGPMDGSSSLLSSLQGGLADRVAIVSKPRPKLAKKPNPSQVVFGLAATRGVPCWARRRPRPC